MKAAIFYYRYLDFNGEERQIGGIETYLHSLSELCIKLDIEPVIFQYGQKRFEKVVDNVRVIGLPVLEEREARRPVKAFWMASGEFDAKKDIVIFGADRHSVSYPGHRCVSIQHGIAWDLPNSYISTRKIWQNRWAGEMYKMLLIQRAIRNYKRCPNRVCVDYNFLNWYRTFLHVELTGRNWIIPNFANIPEADVVEKAHVDDAGPKILFARRFNDYRGTRLMVPVAKSLLKKYPRISFTFAGEGPDESWLKEQFAAETRVIFTKYFPDDIVDIHLKHHIAIVPSIASEGTSLSVAEAMACGCAVAATAIGGVTNMIIDGYNGRLCLPSAKELEKCVEDLIVDKDRRKQIAENAYATAQSAFSKTKWEDSWTHVLQAISKM